MNWFKRVNLRLPSDEKTGLLLIIFMWSVALWGYVNAFVLRAIGIKEIVGYVIPTVIIIWALVSAKCLSKFIRLSDVFFVFICILVYFTHYVLFPANMVRLDEYVLIFIFSSLPFYFVGVSSDINKLWDWFYLISLFVIAMQLFESLVFKPSVGQSTFVDGAKESMYVAYKILPYILYVIGDTFVKFNVVGLLAAILGTGFLISCGSRGPVIMVILFSCLYVLFLKTRKGNRFRLITIVSLLVLFLVTNLDVLILELADIFENIGMSTRVLDLFVAGSFGESEGRDFIRERVLNGIRNMGPLGLGIGGDWVLSGSYAHNIVLEFLCSFGCFFGTVLIAALLVLFCRAYKYCCSIKEKCFFFVLVICGFAKLMLSYTYLDEPMFFMLIGYCVGIIRRNRRYYLTSL